MNFEDLLRQGRIKFSATEVGPREPRQALGPKDQLWRPGDGHALWQNSGVLSGIKGTGTEPACSMGDALNSSILELVGELLGRKLVGNTQTNCGLPLPRSARTFRRQMADHLTQVLLFQMGLGSCCIKKTPSYRRYSSCCIFGEIIHNES
jgi:hypothetical protein